MRGFGEPRRVLSLSVGLQTGCRPWTGASAVVPDLQGVNMTLPDPCSPARVARLSLLFAAISPALLLPAAAQEAPVDEPRTLDAVQVTGTRIRRAEMEDQVPVHTV